MTGAIVAKRASPDQYRATFELHNDGQAVLADLVDLFGSDLFVAGALEGERQTLVNLGQRKVLDHILTQINRTQV